MRVETLVVAFLVMIYLALNPDWTPRDMAREVIGCEEDQPCWNCATMGNRVCGH